MGRFQVTFGMENGDVPIEVLDLTARTYYSLKRRNIISVRQVLLLPKQDLLETVQLTPENFAELRERLIACGFLSPTHLIGPFSEEESDQDTGT